MSLHKDNTTWLTRGSQRRAVAQVMRKPMTSRELCQAARAHNSHIQMRDVWFLMNQFQERGLVASLNPRQPNGRLYYLTDQGRVAVAATFGLLFEPFPHGVPWRKYSWVVRAKIRRQTLQGLDESIRDTGQSQTASDLRKYLRETHPIGLNPVIRALKELEHQGLVECAGTTKLRMLKLYRLTRSGSLILAQLAK